MDETEGLLTDRDLRILRLLDFLHDNGGRDEPNDLREFPGPREDRPALVRWADESGYVTTYRNIMSLADTHPPVLLNGFGVRYVQEVREARGDSIKRARAGRNVLLRWVHDVGGEFVDTPGLLAAEPPRLYFGDAFTEAEVNAAGKYLAEADLLRGTWQANGALVSASLTARGQHCVEDFDSNVRAYVNRHDAGPAVAYTQNFHGSFSGQAAQGQSVHQSQVQNGIPAESLASIFEPLLQAAREIPDPDDRADIEEAIAALRQAASAEQPDTAEVERRAGFLRRQADRIGATAVTTVASVSTTQLLELIAGSI